MRLSQSLRLLVLAVCVAVSAAPAAATQVTGLSLRHSNGQTFVTWNTPSPTGWTYRIYASRSAILDGSVLTPARLLATVGDSTWCDKRLSALSGITLPFVLDSLAPPVPTSKGLFVETPVASGTRWFAVTAQMNGGTEDRNITLGGNALVRPLTEILARPRPIFQRTMQVGNCAASIYTLWTTNRATPLFPAMANRPGQAFGSSISLGTPDFGHALLFLPHQYGGGFYPPACVGPGDYVLKMDDLVAKQDAHDFWFGYSPQYNTESLNNSPALTGIVEDYSARRVLFTLEWARRNFPVDTTQVYVAGGSMGGICAVFLAMWQPKLIAAAWANLPLVDFSSQSDPNPRAAFNLGNSFRQGCDRLWGPVETDLRLADGTPVFDRLNAGVMAASLESKFVPPIITYNGRNDETVGWAEKIPFYQAMNDSRAGGTFYWDRRDHGTAIPSAWTPQMNYGIPYIYRFRTNLSFPAFSNCSADADPGNGSATNGDSVGTINAFLDWDPAVLDQQFQWSANLALRNLTTRWGQMVAPESLTVDVTPRRLQALFLAPGVTYPYRVERVSNGATVQSGVVVVDALGVLTVPAVKVFRSGTKLTIGAIPVAGVDPSLVPGALRTVISPVASPLRASTQFDVTWARGGEVGVDLIDLAGRRMKTVWRGSAATGRQRLDLDLAGVPNGSYALVAREGEAVVSRRIVVIR